jgi:hypothetical protein
MLVSVVISGIAVIALFVAIDDVAASVTRIVGPTILAGLIGVLFTVASVGGVISVAAHPRRPGTTWLQKLFAVVALVVMGLLGVVMLVYAFGGLPSKSGF